MNNEAADWITVALLGRPRGNRGEITAISLSSKPERFQDLKTVYLFGDGSPFDVERTWEHEGTLVFKFRNVDSISDAERLRNWEVRIPRPERVEAEPGEFFHSDLIGCEVRERSSGRLLGVVTGWEEYGGPALLDIDRGKLSIPFVHSICVDIRPEDRCIQVELPEGLEDLNRA